MLSCIGAQEERRKRIRKRKKKREEALESSLTFCEGGEGKKKVAAT